MGFELYGRGGQFRANVSGWCHLLEAGLANGWEPLGTLAPSYWKGPWHGGYATNDGQVVSGADAYAWARALRRGMRLSEVCKTRAAAGHRGDTPRPAEFLLAELLGSDASGREVFESRFAAYCARGGFEIW